MLRRLLAQREHRRNAANLAQQQVRVAEQRARQTLDSVLQNYGDQEVALEYYISKRPKRLLILKFQDSHPLYPTDTRTYFTGWTRDVLDQTRPLHFIDKYGSIPRSRVSRLSMLEFIADIEDHFSKLYYPAILVAVKVQYHPRSPPPPPPPPPTHRPQSQHTPFKFLGPNAATLPRNVVRARLRELQLKHHPNKGGNQNKFKALQAEWERLVGHRGWKA